MSVPLISVLMGVYYHDKVTTMLERSIRSVLEQTVSDIELLLCDNGSSSAAHMLLEEIARQDPRIRFVQREDNFALASKLNACLHVAQGKWLARMDDDDYSCPDRFAKQLATLGNNPDIAFVGSNVELSRDGLPAGVRTLPEKPTVKDFFFVQPFVHPTLMFRREALLAVDGYSEDPCCILCEDYDLLLRLYAKGYRGMNIQEPLLTYTLPHTANGSRKMRHRWNETVTRYQRFKELQVLPAALPYVIKPLAVGLLPEPILKRLKERFS